MLWRIILDYPLGNTDPILPSAIVNLIGADGFSGNAIYEGLDEVLKMDNIFVSTENYKPNLAVKWDMLQL